MEGAGVARRQGLTDRNDARPVVTQRRSVAGLTDYPTVHFGFLSGSEVRTFDHGSTLVAWLGPPRVAAR